MPRWLAPFLLLWLSAGALHAQVKPALAPKDIMDVLDDRQIIVAGDTVSIRILEDRRDAEQHTVPETGVIDTVYLKEVKAAGLTCRKLAELILQKLAALPAHANPFIHSKAPTVVVALDKMTCGLPSMDELDNNTRLQPEYTIGIRIVEDKREQLRQIIAPTGKVQVPYIGLMPAAGLTCAELAAKIKVELEKSFFRHATVLVSLEYKSIEERQNKEMCALPDPKSVSIVSIAGNVAKTGAYDFSEEAELTVGSFLAMAGGHTSKKAVPTIKIVRKTPHGNKIILVNSRALLVEKSKTHDLFLRADDVMFVE